MKHFEPICHRITRVILALSACSLASCGSDDAEPESRPTPDALFVKESAPSDVAPSSRVLPAPESTATAEVEVLAIAPTELLGDEWRAVGPGGGGHLEFPAISPHDPSLMLVACDMSGVYRSEDAGQSWQMHDQVRRITHPPVFHPTDPNVIYVCTRYAIYGHMTVSYGWSLQVSRNGGVSWSSLHTHDYGGFSLNEVSAFVLDPDNPERMWLSFSRSGEVLTSRDGGVSWEACGEGTLATGTSRLIPGGTTGGLRTLFVHSGNHVYRSTDEGATWSPITPTDCVVTDLAGSIIEADGDQGMILYALGKATGTGSDTSGAFWRSRDEGATWQDLSAQFLAGIDSEGRIVQMRRVETSLADPDTIYVSADVRGKNDAWHYGMFKSTDAGDTWKFLFPQYEMYDAFRLQRQHAEFDHFDPGWVPLEFSWSWGGNAMNIALSPSDPNQLLWTDMGRTLGTQDGGNTWKNLYSKRDIPGSYSSRGLDVTGGYRVVFDPHNDNRMWIASNDIGNWRSDDRGLSWRYAMRGAKHRLCMYELRADPDVPDLLYGASAGVHDLPRWRYIARDPAEYPGGFVLSSDGGLNWTTQGVGLPEAACTALVLDPRSDVDSRTLYVVAFGYGVYKSVDSGKTWRRKVVGMEPFLEQNENVFSLAQGPDGTLYAGITKRVRLVPGQRPDSRGGALFRSDDGAETWERVGPQLPEQLSREKNEFSFIWDVAVSPHAPDEVLVACSFDPHSFTSAPGGIYRSQDRGATWQRVFAKARCCRVDYHPSDSDVLFCGTGDGLHWSLDRGSSWQAVEGVPFKEEVNRANVDPRDPDRIWVTTWGGGVWTGLFRK